MAGGGPRVRLVVSDLPPEVADRVIANRARNKAYRDKVRRRRMSVQRRSKEANERRAKREVAWACRETIKAIYAVAEAYKSVGFHVHVDHILPLQGATVSGLHVPANLTVMWACDNQRKRNHFGGE